MSDGEVQTFEAVFVVCPSCETQLPPGGQIDPETLLELHNTSAGVGPRRVTLHTQACTYRGGYS